MHTTPLTYPTSSAGLCDLARHLAFHAVTLRALDLSGNALEEAGVGALATTCAHHADALEIVRQDSEKSRKSRGKSRGRVEERVVEESWKSRGKSRGRVVERVKEESWKSRGRVRFCVCPLVCPARRCPLERVRQVSASLSKSLMVSPSFGPRGRVRQV